MLLLFVRCGEALTLTIKMQAIIKETVKASSIDIITWKCLDIFAWLRSGSDKTNLSAGNSVLPHSQTSASVS